MEARYRTAPVVPAFCEKGKLEYELVQSHVEKVTTSKHIIKLGFTRAYEDLAILFFKTNLVHPDV